MFHLVKIKITIVTVNQLHKSCDSQTWYIFYRFYTYTPDIPICHCVHEVHGLWINVLTISFVFLWVRGPAHYENTQCYFSVGLPRTVCAFVSLTLDNILHQYVPRNTVAKFYPNCFLLLLWKISDQMCDVWSPPKFIVWILNSSFKFLLAFYNRI